MNTFQRLTVAGTIVLLAGAASAAPCDEVPAGFAGITAPEGHGIVIFEDEQAPRIVFAGGLELVHAGLAPLAGAFVSGMPTGAQGGAIAIASGDGSASFRSIEVAIDGDRVDVKLNGERVPPERIRRESNRIVILDERGAEVTSIPMTMGPGGAHGGVVASQPLQLHARSGGTARAVVGGAAGGTAIASAGGSAGGASDIVIQDPWGQPLVMIGIVMDRPDEALQHHLGVDPDAVSVLTEVIKGLPADRAGLQRFDVVTAIDHQAPASPKEIRRALAEREPGSEVLLTVRRGAKELNFEVELEAYDPARMRGAQAETKHMWTRSLPVDPAEIQKLIEESMKDHYRSSLRFAPGEESEGMLFHVIPQAVPVPPAPPVPPSPGMPGDAPRAADRPADQLAERMNAIERRMDEMNARLERLLQRLERSSD